MVSVKPFFVPTSICHWKFSDLPMSQSLRGALKALAKESLSDLNGMHPSDFGCVSDHPGHLAKETDELIAQVRSGQWFCTWRHQEAEPKNDLIQIPDDIHEYSVETLQASVRLQHILQQQGFTVLGQMHGIPFSDFLRFRNCGKTTLKELRESIARLQSDHVAGVTAKVLAFKPEPRWRIEHFSISSMASELNPFDLPISVRLEKVLRSKGINRLADLDGVEFSQILRILRCGKKTFRELRLLVERAEKGEFGAVDAAFSPEDARDLVCSFDDDLDKLKARDREIFIQRVEKQNLQARTLQDLAATFNISRERVRQIEGNVLSKLRKSRGLWRLSRLQALEKKCHREGRLLTSGLLADWLQQTSTVPRYPLSFYIRVFCKLNPQLPASPTS
jgi:hypothetical protein